MMKLRRFLFFLVFGGWVLGAGLVGCAPEPVPVEVVLPTATVVEMVAVSSTATDVPTMTPTIGVTPSLTPEPSRTAVPFTSDARTVQVATLRSGASGNHLRVATVASETELGIQGQNGAWFLVSVNRTVSGWIQKRRVELNPALDMAAIPELNSTLPLPEILTQYEAVTSRPTDIFAGPNVSFPVIARDIPPYSHMRLSGRDELGMWLSVRDRIGDVGWVLASSLKFAPDFQINQLPITVEPAEEDDPLKATYDWSTHVFEWGAQTHDMRHGSEMIELGMQWVKVQSKWHDESRPEDVIGLIEQAHEQGFKILLAIPGQPYPDAIDYDAYVAHLAGIAALPNPPDALEVWNEMNIDFEWPIGEIDPELYVERLLKPSYLAIKQANPEIMVISGAPAPTGFDDGIHAWADDRYVAGMVAAGAGDYADCVGVHYNAGATSPYALHGHPAGDFYGWYFPHVLQAYFRAFSGDKPLCITEIGYLTDGDLEIQGYEMPDNFWWAENTTVDQHAQWLAEAAVSAKDSGVVRMFVVFNADIYHWDGRDPQTGYAMWRPRGNCPACETLAEVDLR